MFVLYKFKNSMEVPFLIVLKRYDIRYKFHQTCRTYLKNTLKLYKKVFQKISLNGKIYHLRDKNNIIKISVFPK